MLQRLTTPSIFLILLLGLFVSMVGIDEALANLIEKPNEPDSLWVTERKNTSVKLNWSGGPGFGWSLNGYRVNYRTKGTTTWTQVPTSDTNLIAGTSVTIPNLQPSTTLEWRVRTRASDIGRSENWSDWSSVAEATTNRPPQRVGSIPDQTLTVYTSGGGGASITIDVSGYFSDPDGDTLTYTENSDLTSLSGSSLRIAPSNTAVKTTVTVTATDGPGASIGQSFTVTVKPATVPKVRAPIGDQTVKVGGSAVSLDNLNDFFYHPDDYSLTFSATSSDTSKATVNVSGSTLTVTAVAAGSATITAAASDGYNTETATQTFSVTVQANSPPVTVGTIPTQTVAVNGSAATVDVSPYFSDPDGDPLTYSATSSDTSKATVSLSGSTVTITAVAAGSATITVTATDTATAAITQTFSVTVQANSAPVRVGSIPTQTVPLAGSAATVDVSPYFSDPDGSPLTYSATSSNTTKASVSVSGSTLTITPIATGWVTITVTGTDPGDASVTQTFSASVTSNRSPVRVGSIPTQKVRVGGTATTVDVSSYFSDPDGNPLTYSVNSSNTSKATVSLSGSTVTITAVAAGSATITVRATDTYLASTTQTFSARVLASDALSPVGSIPTQKVKVGGTAATVDVSSYFNSLPSDTVTYSATSSDTSKVTVSLSGSTVTITAVAAGSATITVTATLNSNATATQTFSVSVPSAPITVGTIPDQIVVPASYNVANSLDVSSYFSDPAGRTLTYTVKSSDTTVASTSVVSGSTISYTGLSPGTATITVTARNTISLSVSSTFTVTVAEAPNTVGTIPNQSFRVWLGGNKTETAEVDVSSYFSDPNSLALTYSASSSDTTTAQVLTSGSTVTAYLPSLTMPTSTSATITVTATNTHNVSATQSFTVTVSVVYKADAVPGLSSTEQLLLGQLLTYDTIIFNELHNGSDDANDWLELRNISSIDILLNNWELTIQTGSGTTIIPFPAGTVIPAGDVLLITNTKLTTAAVVVESFALPETDFALILRSPTAFGDLAGNYFQDGRERPETAPELTADTVWERVQATTSGYRTEAWAVSTHRNGLGSPGYQPSAVAGDLNHDGVVNILDLVLVASQFGTTGITAADLNGDGTVNIQDLVLVANTLGNAAAAPSAKQLSAAVVNNWLQLAQQNTADAVTTSLLEGLSYARGIQVLEQLADELTPDTTALLANYPNPFNPETWIPYQLSKAADVTVTIYASDGTVVRTLAFGHQDAGMFKNRSQAAYWDGTNELGESVASGLYFYTLTAGEFTATRKMLILK